MIVLTFSLLMTVVTSSAEELQNVALRGRATQSTNYPGGLSAAINAIDGNRDPLYSRGSCFVSQTELSPWWRLDLLERHKISYITITNRGDCCADLMNGAEILIGDSLANNGNNNPRCAQITTIPLAATQNFLCNNMEGRYVNIVLSGKTRPINFCEVQVFGVPVNYHPY